MALYEGLNLHDSLNPKIWGKDSKMLGAVKNAIIGIVEEFVDYVDIPMNVVDVQIVGSNASYNYSDKSDIDVHVIVNYDTESCDESILKELYNSKRSSFNSMYDIQIHGLPVEISVQDVNSGIASNGIYSVYDEQWIRFPKKVNNIEVPNITREVSRWSEEIDKVTTSNNQEEIQDSLNRVYLMRRNSIAASGEFGAGNLIFKELRDLGKIQELKDSLNAAIAKSLSLESFDALGQLMNRI